MPKIGGGNNLASRLYTPLYEKGIKETRNKSMATTTQKSGHLLIQLSFLYSVLLLKSSVKRRLIFDEQEEGNRKHISATQKLDAL